MTGRFCHALPRALHFFLATLCLCTASPSLAWNSAGHRLVAAIAWDQLAPEVRDEVVSLLRQHPDYARWIRQTGEEDRERTAFIEASTWPDDIRKDKRFHSSGQEAPTQTLPGFPDMERRLGWHYVNIPLTATAGSSPLSGQLDRQLEELPEILATSPIPAERAYVLPWLIHLVGDVHQPLHTSVRVDAQGKWDKLGSSLKISNPFNSRRPLTTLHAFWDDLPGPPWLRGERLDQAVRALLAAYPRPSSGTSGGQWMRESWTLAREHGYPPDDDPLPAITQAFYENSREIANRRITEAGYRLADLLNRSLDPRRRTQR